MAGDLRPSGKITIDMAKLMNTTAVPPTREYYNSIWAEIHATSVDLEKTPDEKLAHVRNIINKLNVPGGCGCKKDALNFLNTLLNFNDSNINLFANSLEKFFVHYHNLVNSKLSKPIHKCQPISP